MTISDKYWEKIDGQRYETKYNLSVEERARQAADSIRIADSLAAEFAAQNW